MVDSYELGERNIDISSPEPKPKDISTKPASLPPDRHVVPHSFEGEDGEKRRRDAIVHPPSAAWLLGRFIGDQSNPPSWLNETKSD